MDKGWSVILHNYEGREDAYHFSNEKSARETFNAIADAHRKYDEYEREEDRCSWFDADCNEYSTYVWIEPLVVFDDPILKDW